MSTFNVSFPAFIAQAASVAAAAQTVITNAGALFAKVSAIVAQVESDFAAVSGQGATKKQLVMLYLSFAVQELGVVWADVKDLISAFIDSAISLYKTLTAAPAPVVAPQS